MEIGASRMNTLAFISLKLVRWTGCGMADVTLKQGIEVRIRELVPSITVRKSGRIAGYAMSGRYGLSVLADEKTALTLHKLMHLPLGLLVVIHVIPSVYLAFLRWGWIKPRLTP